MQRKLKKLFEEICENNDDLIKHYGEDICPACFLIKNPKNITIMMMGFSSYKEKIIMKRLLLKTLAETELKAYVLIFPSKMTKMAENPEESEALDVVMRTLYTPKETIRNVAIHEGKKIIDYQDFENMDKMQDEWSLWSEHINPNDYDKEILKQYDEFKKANPKLFESVA